jgi:hypothetical protein
MTIPYNVHFNLRECPIDVNAKKYGFSNYSPLPRSSKCGENQFYVCLPTEMAEDFLETMKKCEDCEYAFIRTEDVEFYGDTLSDTHVREIREINNGEILKISVILAKDI